MSHAAAERRVVLVTRRTRLEELVARHHTLGQARFYVEHLGADFSDYLAENEAYARSLHTTVKALEAWGRYQIVDRSLLPNFLFDAGDIIVALGQDGLVANTMKYLRGQPVVGLNPERSRWDGILLPFEPNELAQLLPEVAAEHVKTGAVTMAEARLSDGQVLRAVNDLFIGPRTHTSALYELSFAGRTEWQSSSGLIVSTGLGSTAWLKSVVTGSLAIAKALAEPSKALSPYQALAWDAQQLVFAVREPFPSKTSATELIYGRVDANHPLQVRSRMPEHGVIFSDGIEADYLRFTAGVTASIGLAAEQGRLVL
jgi:NAD kinase